MAVGVRLQFEDEGLRANQQQQIDSVIQTLPKLQFGLDVNVKFNG